MDEQDRALDGGEGLGKGAANDKDEEIANESCSGRNMTEHRSRLSSIENRASSGRG